MTAITHHLPWFIREPGISIIGKDCYATLIEHLELTNGPCLKYSLSKGLGIGIVIGGSFMKVPQVLLILKARSSRGLSLSSYVMESVAYAINLAYSSRNHFPFSTYGENLFLTFQNAFINLLIIAYAPKSRLTRTEEEKRNSVLLAGGITLLVAILLYSVPMAILSWLQVSTLGLSIISKLPQIRQNARSGSTGQLSAFAVGSQVVGCLARLFTTATEVGDILVAASYFLALVLNVILGIQLWLYWGKDDLSMEQNGSGSILPSSIALDERRPPFPTLRVGSKGD